MKAKVNKDVCIGCGACTVIAKDFFVIGDDSLAEVAENFKDKEVNSDYEDDVIIASESCPTSAIEVEE